MRAFGSLAPALQDQLFAADPGLVRLTLAGRGTLSVFMSGVAALIAARFLHVSPVVFANGVTLGMMGPFLMRDATLRQRQRTLLTLVLPASIAVALTTFLHGRGPAGDSCFLVLVFLCFLFQPRGPRMIGVGLVAVVSTYVGLYLELPPATLPLQLASILAAVPIVAFACFVVIPMNPARTLRRIVQAVQWRAAQVLRDARRATENGRLSDTSGRRLRRDLTRLNEAALAADDQLVLMQADGRDQLRTGLINLELAIGRLLEALREAAPGPRHTTRLRLHELRMRRGDPYAIPPASREPGSLLGALVDLGHAVHEIKIGADTMRPGIAAAAPPRPPPGPLAWRLAAQVTLAAGLAMAGGMVLSPNRWFWAVITVYVVFLNARSRGDTIYKGIQRVGGTLLGIASGFLLATWLVGDTVLQTGALLLSVFGMFYLFLISYTLGIFCVTVMLGLLYGMLGAPVEALLILRLEETAIGAACGMIVAALVFPARTRDQVMRSGRNVLSALVEAVRSCREAWAGTSGAAPMEAMRRVDRQVADLRLALAPLTAGRVVFRRSPLERPLPALIACVDAARALAAASQDHDAMSEIDPSVARASGIERRLTQLAEGTGMSGGAADAQAARAGSEPEGKPDQDAVAAALNDLEAAVTILAKRLATGAMEGFGLGA